MDGLEQVVHLETGLLLELEEPIEVGAGVDDVRHRIEPPVAEPRETLGAGETGFALAEPSQHVAERTAEVAELVAPLDVELDVDRLPTHPFRRQLHLPDR